MKFNSEHTMKRSLLCYNVNSLVAARISRRRLLRSLKSDLISRISVFIFSFSSFKPAFKERFSGSNVLTRVFKARFSDSNVMMRVFNKFTSAMRLVTVKGATEAVAFDLGKSPQSPPNYSRFKSLEVKAQHKEQSTVAEWERT